MYLAHHEVENVFIIVIINVISNLVVVVVINTSMLVIIDYHYNHNTIYDNSN